MTTTVRTPSGRLGGVRAPGGEFLFGGIPYAAPPTGPNRLRPPAPPEPWDGDRPAASPGPAAPQVPVYGVVGEVYGSRLRQDPDCLTLTVRTPSPSPDGLPVLVWLHGGGFAVGAGGDPPYQGGAFARRGIVEVTVNHRLGAEGYALLGDTANLGLRDQLAALEWVRDNIAEFGGDPGRVTVAGHSSGAMSVACLLASPHRRDLFGRAIVQSPMAPAAIDEGSARGIAALLAEELGVPAHDRAAVAALPHGRLLEAQRVLCDMAASGEHAGRFGAAAALQMAFTPVVDGDLVPRDPAGALADGAAAGVPVLGGHTRDEAVLHLDHALGGAEPGAEVAAMLIANLIAPTGLQPDAVRAAYRAARPGASELTLAGAVASDLAFSLAAQSVLAACAPHSPTYAYRFDRPAVRAGRFLGAMHGAELPYVFADGDTDLARTLGGDEGFDADLAERVHGAWAAFIEGGAPAHPKLPEWTVHTLDRRETMLLDGGDQTVEDDPNRAERTVWQPPVPAGDD